MKYLRQIHSKETDIPEPSIDTRWARIKAKSPQEAVIKQLHPTKLGPGTFYIWIALDAPENKWSNGQPFCVHRFEVKIGPQNN